MSPLDAQFKKRLNALLVAWQDAVHDALKRAQKERKLRKDMDPRAAALFIVSAWEGCVGVAKNLQSVQEYGLCLKQLDGYIAGLLA
jgi:hypothetical protein